MARISVPVVWNGAGATGTGRNPLVRSVGGDGEATLRIASAVRSFGEQ